MRNKTLKRILIGWVVLIALVALMGEISVAASDAGRTAADFLQIGPGARAAGLGNAFTAVSEGALASYWNPAGLSVLDHGEVLFSHFAWYQDIALEYGSFAYPLHDGVVAGVSFTYLNYGQIDGYDAGGLPTGDLTAYDWAAALSLGVDVRDNLSLGVSAKYVRQQLDSYDAAAPAVDLGVMYRLDRVNLALAVVNVGGKMNFEAQPEKLPSAARVGVSVVPFSADLTGAFEIVKEFYGGVTIRQGVEAGFDERYYLRTGYDHRTGEDGRSFMSGLSFGAGLRFDFGQFDYAYSPRDNATSEDLHRFSVTFKVTR
ncbi:MAG TPA: PorV/PorQ family protein [Acidobacteriota bacterium]|nr:PorV/PorQ family protein [Acidobacteriota bacterium]